jgi:hypothetical protein
MNSNNSYNYHPKPMSDYMYHLKDNTDLDKLYTVPSENHKSNIESIQANIFYSSNRNKVHIEHNHHHPIHYNLESPISVQFGI